MRRDIEVSDRKEDQVSEGLQTPESRGAILQDLEQTVDAFAHRIGQRPFNESEDVVEVVTQGRDKPPERGEAASESRGHPALQESLGGSWVLEVPEMVELIFEHPGAVNVSIGGPQPIEKPRVALGTVTRMHAQ